MAKSPFQARLEQMQRGLEQVRRNAPKVASQAAQEEFDLNFRDQGLRVDEGRVEKWKARQRPDRSRTARRAARRAILVKSGELRRSFRTAPQPGWAVVQNTAPYASIHNRGGRIRGQMRAWATNRRSRMTRLRRSGNPAYMPARPFMVTTPLLMRKIEQALHAEVVRAMKPKGTK